MALFWLVFDIVPVMLIANLHKINFSTYNMEDKILICEMSERAESFISEATDPQTFAKFVDNRSFVNSQYIHDLIVDSDSDSDGNPDDELQISKRAKPPKHLRLEFNTQSSKSKGTYQADCPSSTQSKHSLQVTLMLHRSLKMGFIPSFVYKEATKNRPERK